MYIKHRFDLYLYKIKQMFINQLIKKEKGNKKLKKQGESI